MAKTRSKRLFERIQKGTQAGDAKRNAIIPLYDDTSFFMLSNEVARIASEHPSTGLTIMVDSQTAGKVDALDAARAVCDNVFVFGEAPTAWLSAENLTSVAALDAMTDMDRFLVAISSDMDVAIFGRGFDEDGEPEDKHRFEGGWTCRASHVRSIAELLLEAGGLNSTVDFAEPAPATVERTSACSTQLMALLAQRLSAQQHDVAMDKQDLFSVLDILKAISAKRRAHDILFVFVERIARIVDTARCSVVRVWGGEDKGHVLASHEDARVHDLIIELAKYPEIRRSLQTREKVVINDVWHDPLTRDFAGQLKAAKIGSLLVVPIVLFDQNVGSLVLRAARRERRFTAREVGFCEIVAEAAANALERAHLFESIQKANERLEYLAITDGLTGLYNHRHFHERLEEEFERARRYRVPLSCLMLDIDDFKQVNDTYGHLQGDNVLREMAARILRTVRKSDTVARYGGEEFVIIMPQTGAHGAAAEAERLRHVLGSAPYEGMPEEVRVTVSVGVAVLEQDAMRDCEAIIRVADGALYRAKHKGKNRIVVAGPEGDVP
ncbi:MAG TPA: sensor domain-containing diguanylate cyclase [Candidatus Hydrogenedentes bacterium]|nr:sensor domain-containing diguanylate cyclase [Candidatus Hydrogenedentota bacterium]HIJ73652.1 sensor domain-containing diguanylate cyclase [Candidatus Hydrogenedentota bacterium]